MTSGTAVVAIMLGAALGAASASFAKDAGPPTIDIQTTCRENVAALRSVLGTSIRQDMDVCKSDEEQARQQLVKEWASYPTLAKSQCVKPHEYLPGYVEWLSCIEMTRGVLQSRRQEAAPTTIGSSGTRSSSRHRAGAATGAGTQECPITKYTEDGSIDHVINC